ncbi:outer membrane beta-barrel protein [Neptunomonas sp.]|uniref:outer membrane beta-barrel protein n=1 Tax=Neptunomonas sp. TaxID=1971898 RepID=UPI003564F9E6
MEITNSRSGVHASLLISSTLFTSLIALPMSAQAIEPASVSLGPVSMIPQLTVSTGRNDNIFYTSTDEKSSAVTVINPVVQFIAEDGANAYKLTADIRQGIYHSSQDDNYTDMQLQGDANLVFDVRNKLDLLAAYLKAHEARGTGLTEGANATVNDAPIKYDEKTAGATYTYGADEAQGRIVGKLSYTVRDYTNFRSLTTSRDRDTLSTGVTFYYRVMPKTSLLFEARRTEIDYQNEVVGTSSLDSSEWKYLVGATWDATAKTTGVVKAGYAQKDFSAADRDDEGAFTWEAEVSWAPRTYSTFVLRSGQELEESNGADNYIDTSTTSLTWDHAWDDRLKTALAYGFTSEEYDLTSRKDDTNSFSAGVSYDLRRWLTVGMDITHAERDSNQAGFDYDNNTLVMTVQGAL